MSDKQVSEVSGMTPDAGNDGIPGTDDGVPTSAAAGHGTPGQKVSTPSQEESPVEGGE